MGEPEPGRLEEEGRTGEPELGKSEEVGGMGELVPTSLLSSSDRWRALAATCFSHCFSSFNRLALSQEFSLSSSLLSSVAAIASSILPSLPQSTSVHLP